MGRGKANVRTKLKHIKTGAVIEKVFSPNENFARPDIVNKKMQYLYENTGEYAFMDSETFEQISVPVDGIGDARWYLLENEEYTVLFLDGEAISITISIGVAGTSPDAQARDLKTIGDALLARSDVALYRAKSAGRNRVCLSRDES